MASPKLPPFNQTPLVDPKTGQMSPAGRQNDEALKRELARALDLIAALEVRVLDLETP